MSERRQYDVILWGVTGFTGQLAAQHLARHYAVGDYRIILAGRSSSRLEPITTAMFEAALNSPIERVREAAIATKKTVDTQYMPTVDFPDWGQSESATNQAATEMCQMASTIISFAGPYGQIGEPIVKAAAENGTDYVDITGEVHWVEEMTKKYGEKAKTNKCRLLFCSGHDYVLNDLGIRVVATRLEEETAATADTYQVDQLCVCNGTTFSSGTLKSAVDFFAKPHHQSNRVPMMWYSKMAKQWGYQGSMTEEQIKYMSWVLKGIKTLPSKTVFRIGDKAKCSLSAFWFGLATKIKLCMIKTVAKIDCLRNRFINRLPQTNKTYDQLVSQQEGCENSCDTRGQISQNKVFVHTGAYNKGNAYVTTAIAALEVAFCSIELRRLGEGKVGTSSPADLLGIENLTTRLQKAGFQFSEFEIDI